MEQVKTELLQVVERTRGDILADLQTLRRDCETVKEKQSMDAQRIFDQMNLTMTGHASLMQALRRDQDGVSMNLADQEIGRLGCNVEELHVKVMHLQSEVASSFTEAAASAKKWED
eukprot:3813880-Amphidinium_carterae.1